MINKEAFAAGWFVGYWSGTNEVLKQMKIKHFLKTYYGKDRKHAIEFTLGRARGDNDKRMMGGTDNESVQLEQSGEVETDIVRLGQRFGNARSQLEN